MSPEPAAGPHSSVTLNSADRQVRAGIGLIVWTVLSCWFSGQPLGAGGQRGQNGDHENHAPFDHDGKDAAPTMPPMPSRMSG
jgi:hypothetical protein